MEEEIDLRRYVKALFRYWWLVVIPPIIAAVAAIMATSNQPPNYEAQVYVAATKLKVQVQFGSEVQMLTEEELTSAGVQALGDRKARLAAFRALVVNPEIAQTVLPQFADRLKAINESLLDPARFLDHVSSEEEGNAGDLIMITVSMSDPQLAADIANAWGEAYEQLVNRLYSGVRPQDVEAAHRRTEEARQTYQDAQAELEAYLSDSRIPRLDSQIAILQAELDGYQSALEEIQSLASGGELVARHQLLTEYYQDQVTLQRLLDDARALEQQLSRGESSPAGALGDALAMIFTRSRAFAGASTDAPVAASEGSAPLLLQLQVPLTAENITTSDVENLIWVLEDRKEKTEARIAELTAALLDPPEYILPDEAGADMANRIEELTAEMQALQAHLEAETAHQQDLTRWRDLAWDTYGMLARSEAEVRVAAESGGAEVRVASRAVPPARPTSRGLFNIAAAGALGLMLGVFGGLAVEWWRGGEEKERQGDRSKDQSSTLE